jgi:hypothetical protein
MVLDCCYCGAWMAAGGDVEVAVAVGEKIFEAILGWLRF